MHIFHLNAWEEKILMQKKKNKEPPADVEHRLVMLKVMPKCLP
jgi:hypothetical protein